ncbi:hypothetical protein B7494_g2774 [Chlorociboria aeruginascens]|nr:hypothetical protein B7494_g2774 [Chlorociboria aeruginascens]
MDADQARKEVNSAIVNSGSAQITLLVDTANASKRKRKQNQIEKEARQRRTDNERFERRRRRWKLTTELPKQQTILKAKSLSATSH